MPWINETECVGCGICVRKCPIGAISMEDNKARIDMSKCIRCGICHDVCPLGVIRHDSEKIEKEMMANIDRTKENMESCAKYLGDVKEKRACLNRTIKYFNKEKRVVEKTLEELEKLK